MPEPPDLQRHLPALAQWAAYLLPDWLRARLDPADLVHQTLLEAVRAPAALAGRADHEVLAYLRRALANNLTDATRKHGRARADVSAEAAAASSARLAADHTSSSERAERNERFARLAAALAGLPDTQAARGGGSRAGRTPSRPI